MAYIESGYSPNQRCDYVQAYLELLHTSVRNCHCDADVAQLEKIIAFETFYVSDNAGGLVAGTFNVRNPVYLLSRIAKPSSPDNPKYLPLICPLIPSMESSRLYRHYRRITIAGRMGVQLFVYLPDDSRNHPLSHALIGRLFMSLTSKTDPWVHERSRVLFNGVFSGLTSRLPSARIRLLDIACGSAKITMSLCRKSFAVHHKSFDLTLVDVVRGHKSIATAFFRNPSVFGNVIYRRDHLFDWVDANGNAKLPRFDVVLMLRVCDVFSHIQIDAIPPCKLLDVIRQQEPSRTFDAETLQPARLLERNQLEGIDLSIQSVSIQNGSAFRQFSLSDYFEAVHIIMIGEPIQGADLIHLPVRCFDDSVLVLTSGRSLISQLMAMGDRMLIEDAELSADRLREHFNCHKLNHLEVRDVTREVNTRGAKVSLIEKRA